MSSMLFQGMMTWKPRNIWSSSFRNKNSQGELILLTSNVSKEQVFLKNARLTIQSGFKSEKTEFISICGV